MTDPAGYRDLRLSVDAGRYRVDPAAVAQAILDRLGRPADPRRLSEMLVPAASQGPAVWAEKR